jgi:hypothetical protein
MSGRNRYLDVQSQYTNLRESFEKRAGFELATASWKPPEPCIFLSHRSTDKAAVRKIGDYIMSKGIDVYLDADDTNLQRAVANEDHKAITAAIELGIGKSTDLFAFVTQNSMSQKSSSIWVPYEIGFAKRHGNPIAAVKSRDITQLPSYLVIVPQILNIRDLNAYLRQILSRKQVALGSIDLSRHIIAEQLKQASAGSELGAYLDS